MGKHHINLARLTEKKKSCFEFEHCVCYLSLISLSAQVSEFNGDLICYIMLARWARWTRLNQPGTGKHECRFYQTA